jgi:hypothetical protein
VEELPSKPKPMKTFIQIIVALCSPMMVFSQDITGLWKGSMYNDSTKQSIDYEVVVTRVKGKLTGYSNTSYVVNDTKYYSFKKINVRVAKDGKIVFQDAKMLSNNYTDQQNKNIIQLNVLDLAGSGEESFLDGIFVTNRSKAYQAFTGRLSIKKVNPLLVKSELVDYLEKNAGADELTAAN